MKTQNSKLEQIICSIKDFHFIEESEIKKLMSAFDLLTNCLSNSGYGIDEEVNSYYVDHSLSVAQHIASWRFDCNVVAAAILYILPTNRITPLAELKLQMDDDIYTVLEGCADIHDQIISHKLNEFTQADHMVDYELSSRYPESFYIEIAAHIDILSQKFNSQIEDILTFAQKTREILIPQIKYIHAYKMADFLEELCFEIENRTAYDIVCSIIGEVDDLNEFSRKKFITKLKQIFDRNSNITPENLREFQTYIKLFSTNKRSLASIYRYITHNNGRDAHLNTTFSNDILKLKNFSRTAFYDLILVIDDEIMADKSCSTIDVFMEYFEAMLRPLGVFLYGYYQTTDQDACYFLLSDPVKNMYRFFVKTESQHLRYLYGDIVQDKFILHQAPKKAEDTIKVFKKDGTAEIIEKGITVLDFAFIIHEDLGLHFGNAILNQNGKPQPAYTILNNGDTVEIKKSEYITAELNWFRYLKTELAINYLIKHFKTQFRQSGRNIRVLTKDGHAISVPEGATVLDFAFFVYEDKGTCFDYALVNQSKKHYAVDHVLYDGDTVMIQKSPTAQADYYWFRHVKTTKAINYLIEYFKSKDNH